MTIADPKVLAKQNGNRVADGVIDVIEEAPQMTGAQITCAALEAESPAPIAAAIGSSMM